MLELLGGFALGLAGSLHCAGMCGPIAIALPNNRSSWPRHITEKMTYQFGRVITYTTLGAIVGLGGSAISLFGYGQLLSILSGAMMIAVLLLQLLWRRELIAGRQIERIVAPLKHRLSKLLAKHGTLAHLGIGLLNGLLPCGLVTAALVGAVGFGSLSSSAVFMFGFGLGTMPVMSAIAIGSGRLSCITKQRLRFASPAIGFIVAVLFLLRGMALGIPHVSPVVKPPANANASCMAPTVECCK